MKVFEDETLTNINHRNYIKGIQMFYRKDHLIHNKLYSKFDDNFHSFPHFTYDPKFAKRINNKANQLPIGFTVINSCWHFES